MVTKDIKVLIAEDDSRLLRAYEFALSDAGYDVTAVTSGEAAHAALVSKQFDVAITDIQMGGTISGVLIAGKGVIDYPNTKIIVVTGMIGLAGSAVGRAGLPGAHATLFKPVEAETLLREIETVLADTDSE